MFAQGWKGETPAEPTHPPLLIGLDDKGALLCFVTVNIGEEPECKNVTV